MLRKRLGQRVLANQWEIPYLDMHHKKEWVRQTLLPHFELYYAFKHTIMTTQYNVWWVEAGRLSRPLPEHVFLDRVPPDEPLTSITRKALRQEY